jgi:ElaB/YqjD/DUF883 family membrane-anchored ribosome-binding protein
MGQSTPVSRSTAADVAVEATATMKDIGATGAALAEQGGAVAQSAREALAEMRVIVERFAATTGEKAGEAADAVKATGADTAERVAGLVDDARTLGREGLDGLADAVAKRPVAALAVAAGVGLLLGLVTRTGGER